MSRPPNEDDGDAGSARARTAAPGDRARATRGAIGVETAARAAVAMVAFKPAWTGRRGARRQSRREFPEKIRPRVKFRRLPTVWPRGWIGVSTSAARIDARGAYRRSRRVSTLAKGTPPCAESRAPVPRAARRGSSRRLVSSARQTAWGRSHWREEENEHPAQPPGRITRVSWGRRARDARRFGSGRSPRGYLRTFRARLGRPGWVCRVCRGLCHGSTASMALSPAAGTISSLG